MEAIVVYNNKKDKELLDLVSTKFPIFIHYINSNTKEGIKEAYSVKSHWAARLEPFVVVKESEQIIKVMYSEKYNAVQQLINYLNDSSKVQKT